MNDPRGSRDGLGCRRRSVASWRGATVVIVLATAGCQQTLFPPEAPRTQYEKYDRMRNRYTPTEEPDAFGNPRPALRARLSQP